MVENNLRNIFPKTQVFYYDKEDTLLLSGNPLELISRIKAKSINCIFADPPYFLSNGGITNSGGEASLSQ